MPSITFPAFYQVMYTTSAAVAQNGTFTLAYPQGTNVGFFSGARDSRMFVDGVLFHSSAVQIQNSSGIMTTVAPGFSLAFGASITVTYLGATTIPANTPIFFQLELIGQDRPSPYAFQAFDSTPATPMYVRFGAPATASATAILNGVTTADALLHTLTTPYQLDVARNIAYVAGSAGDTTQTITVRGTDRYGMAMTETVTLNGTTSVPGKKAFYVVNSYQASAALTTTLSLGSGVVLGLPVIFERKRFAWAENVDDATVTTGTFVIADATVPSATTGDIRGTYSPATAPNGAHIYELLVAVPDEVGPNLLQFAG